MRVLVFALTSTNGGALSNLKEIYSRAVESHDEWVFITGDSLLTPSSSISVESYPKYRKSKIGIILFLLFKYNKILKHYNPDLVYNLQYFNKKYSSKYKFIFYATNALFFTDLRFSLKQSPSLWLRQRFITPLEYKCIRRSYRIVVECSWMKKKIMEKLNIDEDRILVQEHLIVLKTNYHYKKPVIASFVYPTSCYSYKNFETLFKAISLLFQRNKSSRFVFYLTLTGSENRMIRRIKRDSDSRSLPIVWTGYVDKEKLYSLYSSSVLVFPSRLETIGLPLIEAKQVGCPIICSDLEYAHSVMGDYSNVYFFDCDDDKSLCNYMELFL